MNALERLRGRLVVSVQAESGSPLAEPRTIAILARAVVQNGAAAVRIEGIENIAAVRAAVDVPIIGLTKREYSGFWPYITTSLEEVAAIAAAGADIVAFDATGRQRMSGTSIDDLTRAAQRAGRLAMADCAGPDDARGAVAAGADLLATTLAGYTTETAGRTLPALDLVATMIKLHPFVVCEGGIAEPGQAHAAFAAGASAIVVGTAITNVDALTRRFVEAVQRAPGATHLPKP